MFWACSMRGKVRMYMADSRGKVKGGGHSEYCDVNGRKSVKEGFR